MFLSLDFFFLNSYQIILDLRQKQNIGKLFLVRNLQKEVLPKRELGIKSWKSKIKIID